MWTSITRLILRHRLTNIIIIGLLTLLMGYFAVRNQMSYELAKALPDSDSTMIAYNDFLKQFGQDGTMVFVAVEDSNMFQLEHYNAWYDLDQSFSKMEGVNNVLSISSLFNINLDLKNSLKREDWDVSFDRMPKTKPTNQAELDSLAAEIKSLDFYDGLLFNKKNNVWLMIITLDKQYVNTKGRDVAAASIQSYSEQYSKLTDTKVHISGMPYIRTKVAHTIKSELLLFTCISMLIAMIILLIFFRSLKVVLPIMILVLTSVIFLLGIVGLFGFKITVFMSVLPPILIIIGVENSIFLLNKYYSEYQRHHNKVKALSCIIRRIGSANLLTNATTAAGFASFIITQNEMLIEFGVVAAISIFIAYFLALFLIPIFFSYMPPPCEKDFSHFERGGITKFIDKIVWIVFNRRTVVYCITGALVIISFIGLTKLRTIGRMVDDISKKDVIYHDLTFFEKHLNGIIPLEISIEIKKDKNGKISNARRAATLTKIGQLQDTLATYPQLSKPLSIVEAIKFANQKVKNVPGAINNRNDLGQYSLPNTMTLKMIMDEVSNSNMTLDSIKLPALMNSFIDKDLTKTRVSIQMHNLTTPEIDNVTGRLTPQVNKIFPTQNYNVNITGSSIVNKEGTKYLTTNLLYSLVLAFFIIALLMALTFTSFKMVLIAMIPNLIPQLLTAGLMGYLGIPLKMSTILIFSVALGISVDNTIHFLARYRLHLRSNNFNISKSVKGALLETSYSMITSAVVLLSGFLIFCFSSFKGTQIVGYLVPFTLFMALFSNLMVLPCILLTFNKKIITKSFNDSLIEMNQTKEEKEEIEQIISESISEK